VDRIRLRVRVLEEYMVRVERPASQAEVVPEEALEKKRVFYSLLSWETPLALEYWESRSA
jgi:hypothetical protein